MNITHHPSEDLLAGFGAGTLDEADHLVVAVHVSLCAHCRQLVRAVEALGGVAVEQSDAVPMRPGAFDALLGRIDRLPPPPHPATPPDNVKREDYGLPVILRKYRIGSRRRIAPGVSVRPIELSGSGSARAFLLRSSPGTRMLEHTHSGTELTCVLHGSFRHDGGRFGYGDFDFGDGTVDHQPVVGKEEDCLCVVAMTGDLRMNGFFGRLISPFVRL